MTTTTEKPITLNPLAIVNGKIVEAKRDAREEGERRRMGWMAHKNGFASVPFNAGPAMVAALETAYINEGNRLRSASQNYRPEAFISGLLDVDENKPALEDALRHVEAKYADVLKRKAAAPAVVAPKRNGLAKLIESALGAPVEPEPAFPPPRPPVIGGPWGKDAPLDISLELKRITDFVATFPVSKSFEQIAGMLNAADSAVVALTPDAKPAQAVRHDKGWVVPAHM